MGLLRLAEELSLKSVWSLVPDAQKLIPASCVRRLKRLVQADPIAYSFRYDFVAGCDGSLVCRPLSRPLAYF